MAARTPQELSTEELAGKIRAMRSIHLTTSAIFAVIVLAWLVLGYWRKNLPVFIATVTMAVAITVMQRASRSALERELLRRRPG